ncbi:ECF transporter S component [Heyndrickxia acidicola]|uniref:ECF transporter S component n=1 Tax=Heyndrickxia acidicola TaxID=209389 RepID=A0ABU6MGU0_9BACI|nr:ECF transporter S component [Heyndrickxia acidicola]MED1203891.1 ECF transporter S component [Heyndrickxia acidicola]
MNQTKRQNKTYRITVLGVLIAIIVLQTFIPFLGYIPIGPLSLTIIQITVIITAFVLGPKDGAIIGGVWGLITFIRAFSDPTSPIAPIIFVNPLISVLPRILIGIFAGYSYKWLKKTKLGMMGSMPVAALLGSLTNTILVLGLTYLFYKQPYAEALHMNVSKVLPALLSIVATNGIAEAIASFIVAPIISRPLLKLRQH